jgi:hypothetical protein
MVGCPEAMYWPTWRSKLLPVTFLRLSWNRPCLHLSIGGNRFFGNWWAHAVDVVRMASGSARDLLRRGPPGCAPTGHSTGIRRV